MFKHNKGDSLSEYEQTVYKTLVSHTIEITALEKALIDKNLITADDLRRAAGSQDVAEQINAAALAADMDAGVEIGASC